MLSFTTKLSHCAWLYSPGWCFCYDLDTHASFRFDISPWENSVDLMLKSDSESLSALNKSQTNPCKESFTKSSSEEVEPQKEIKGYYQP